MAFVRLFSVFVRLPEALYKEPETLAFHIAFGEPYVVGACNSYSTGRGAV